MFKGQNWLKNSKNGCFWGNFNDFEAKLAIFGAVFEILGQILVFFLQF